MRIRQGQSRWIRVAKVRDLFDDLAREGFYIRDGNSLLGPFTQERLDSLAHKLPSCYWLKKGIQGSWQRVGSDAPTGRLQQMVESTSRADFERGDDPGNASRFVAKRGSYDDARPGCRKSFSRFSLRRTHMGLSRDPGHGASRSCNEASLNHMENAVEGLFEKVEKILLGDPLSN